MQSRRPSHADSEPARTQRVANTIAQVFVEESGKNRTPDKLPASEREALFARGARLDTGKPGTGLGLSIVRSIVQAQRATCFCPECQRKK